MAEPASQPKGRIAPFGKYLLLQRVSVGGMAEVFKALPTGSSRIDQIVAIKRILPNIAEDSEFIGMFIDEARIAGQLTHPNICRIYELGRVRGDHYIAMQFLWGRDLLKVMNRLKKLGEVVPPPAASFIAAKACAALHYAHTKCDASGEPLNIIHRDVSPQNIIVGYSGQVKLIDFGVARAASQSQKTQAGILKGKFGYMSPEMIRSLPVDHRSDVFAMGICLHEALTGSRLFYGETDFATLEQVRDARVVPPSAKVPGIPAALDAIVLKALARDVQDRYASAQDMEQALYGFLDSHYPGFGEADVGVMMREAFAQEVVREKQRLEIFGDMLSRGALVRGATVPPLPSEPPPSGERAAKSSGEQGFARGDDHATTPSDPLLVTRRSELTEEELAKLSGEHDVHDEQTQIFFSADELDELREIESEPRISLDDLVPAPNPVAVRQPAPSDVIMRGAAPWAPRMYEQQQTPSDRPARPSGMYERSPSESRRAPVYQSRPLDERRIPTMTFKAGPQNTPVPELEALPLEREREHSRRMVRRSAVVGLALILLGAGYGLTRMAQHRTATLEIDSLGDPDALVRIDGVLRGNPPLSVDGLEPGVHEVAIDARGYEPVRISVHVAPGESRAVQPVLQRLEAPGQAPSGKAAPKVDSLPAPTVQPQAPSGPTTSALPVPAAVGPAPIERAKPVAPRGRPRPAQAAHQGDPSSPSVQRADVGETEIAEAINEETLAEGQGELLISTLPWSRVFIDGVDSGRDTPVRSLRVPAGAHRIGLRTPDNLTHDVEVDVEAGKVVRIIRRF
ncbi:MAG: protein kinase [Myxococcales bacterium]